jgi:hypothetical protein
MPGRTSDGWTRRLPTTYRITAGVSVVPHNKTAKRSLGCTLYNLHKLESRDCIRPFCKSVSRSCLTCHVYRHHRFSTASFTTFAGSADKKAVSSSASALQCLGVCPEPRNYTRYQYRSSIGQFNYIFIADRQGRGKNAVVALGNYTLHYIQHFNVAYVRKLKSHHKIDAMP